MKVTIKDIARYANVSIATVSMVVNKKDQRIGEDTKQRVLKAIEDLGYVPNRLASSMKTKKTKAIGLVLPDIRNPFFPELAKGVEDCAQEHGYHVILCNTNNSIAKEQQSIEMLREKMVEAIILTASGHSQNNNLYFEKLDIPLVTVDRPMEGKGLSGAISTDNELGSYHAVKYLYERGYQQIIHLSGPMNLPTSQARYNGYERACEEFGTYKAMRSIECTYSIESGYQATNELILSHKVFDGLFCGNDLIAIGAIKALHEHNIQIPDQVGIVGFDDIYMAELITPPLTTVRQPIYDIGYNAMHIALQIIDHSMNNELGKSNLQKVHKKLDTSLIIRRSTR